MAMTGLGAIRGHSVYPVCAACGREGARLVVADLIARYGPEEPLDAVLARLRCAGCGCRGRVNITLSFTETAPSASKPIPH